MANYNLNAGYGGLGAFTLFAAPSADTYIILGKTQTPGITKGNSQNSQLVIVIKQNGSTIFTSNAGLSGFRLSVSAAAGDLFTMVLSSSDADESVLNRVRISVSIWEGI